MDRDDIEQSIRLPARLKDYATDPHRRYIILDIHDELAAKWCLLLCMLEKGLINGITVSDGQVNVLRMVLSGAGQSKRGLVTWKGDFAELTVARNEVDVLTHFFLRYIRDGVADVDHLDLDMDPSRSSAKAAVVTITVLHARPPLSRDELRQRL